MNYIHERSIIHRDLKSDNILFNMDGDVAIADFGHSKTLTTDKRGTKSRLGTVWWMAPELIKRE